MIYSQSILNEVISNISHGRKNIGLDLNITSKNIKYRLFRYITTQKLRDKIWNFLICINRVSKHSVSDTNDISYNFFLDYVQYTIKNNPPLPFSFFPESDHKQIVSFLQNMYYFAFVREPNGEYMYKNDMKTYIDNRYVVSNNLKISGKYFRYHDFLCPSMTEFGVIDDQYGIQMFHREEYRTIIDLGACCGESAFVFDRKLKPKCIYAFEPDSDNYRSLLEAIKINNMKNVKPVRLATSRYDTVSYFSAGRGPSSGITNDLSLSTQKVKTVKIDTFLSEKKIRDVDLIKMDIEGAEFDTLKGAKKTLKQFKPDLIIAIYHKGEHLFEIPAWLKKNVPEYNLRFISFPKSSLVFDRVILASVNKIQ